MRRSVAQFLEARLDPSALVVDETAVKTEVKTEGDEVRQLLRAGLVRSVRFAGGRLLGEVALRELLGAGYIELARRWAAAAAAVSPPLRRVLAGERPSEAELAAASFSELALILLAFRAAGALTLEDVALLHRLSAAPDAGASADRSGLAFLRELLERPLALFWPPLSDEPPQPVAADRALDPSAFLDTGDLPGCLRLLEAERARAQALGAAYDHGTQLAEMRFLLTGERPAT